MQQGWWQEGPTGNEMGAQVQEDKAEEVGRGSEGGKGTENAGWKGLAANKQLKALWGSLWKTIPWTLTILSSTMMTFQNHGAACCTVLQKLMWPCPAILGFNLHLSAHSEQVTKEAVTSLWCNQYHLHLKLKGSLLSPHPSCLISWLWTKEVTAIEWRTGKVCAHHHN